jgi:hypothetical protein
MKTIMMMTLILLKLKNIFEIYQQKKKKQSLK